MQKQWYCFIKTIIATGLHYYDTLKQVAAALQANFVLFRELLTYSYIKYVFISEVWSECASYKLKQTTEQMLCLKGTF